MSNTNNRSVYTNTDVLLLADSHAEFAIILGDHLGLGECS